MCVVQISRPVPEWVDQFPGRDVKSPGKWDACQNKSSTLSQIRPRIPSIPPARTRPKDEEKLKVANDVLNEFCRCAGKSKLWFYFKWGEEQATSDRDRMLLEKILPFAFHSV